MPLVTVGVPVRNGARFLEDVLKALLAQHFEDFEILVSDNASTDETPVICRRYAERDPRIRYVRQDVNLGAVGNFKFLLAHARGKYFMFAAADDQWAPTFVGECVKAMECDPTISLAFAAYQDIDENNRPLGQPIRLEYPSRDQVRRLSQFARLYNDVCFYGVMRSSAISGRLLISRGWPLENVIHDCCYPFLVGIIAAGRVACVSEKPLYYRRVWSHDHEGEHYFPISFWRYALLKVLIFRDCLKAICQVARSPWVALAVSPAFFLRMCWEIIRRPRYLVLWWNKWVRRPFTRLRIWLEQHIFWRWMR